MNWSRCGRCWWCCCCCCAAVCCRWFNRKRKHSVGNGCNQPAFIVANLWWQNIWADVLIDSLITENQLNKHSIRIVFETASSIECEKSNGLGPHMTCKLTYNSRNNLQVRKIHDAAIDCISCGCLTSSIVLRRLIWTYLSAVVHVSARIHRSTHFVLALFACWINIRYRPISQQNIDDQYTYKCSQFACLLLVCASSEFIVDGSHVYAVRACVWPEKDETQFLKVKSLT